MLAGLKKGTEGGGGVVRRREGGGVSRYHGYHSMATLPPRRLLTWRSGTPAGRQHAHTNARVCLSHRRVTTIVEGVIFHVINSSGGVLRTVRRAGTYTLHCLNVPLSLGAVSAAFSSALPHQAHRSLP